MVTEEPQLCWTSSQHNWHFLFNQGEDDALVIHTREGHEHGETTPPVFVALEKPNAAFMIASTVRKHGGLAKQRLQTKWQKLNLSPDDLSEEENAARELATIEQETEAPDQKQIHRNINMKDRFRIAFCDAMNDQCYKLGKHVCIVLNGNACGDAAMIQHDWTERDIARYAASRTLPISLVDGEQPKSFHLLVLRFLPHSWPPRVPPLQIFEPAWGYTTEIPLCKAQPFIYVSATGSLPSLDRRPCIDKLILLPSEATGWLDESNMCSACDDETKTREWKPLVHYIRDRQKENNPGSSLVQAPFLKSTTKPLEQMYDFADGSVHEYIDGLLSDHNSIYITSMNGPKGLLQRQWNHGSLRHVKSGGGKSSGSATRK